MADSPPIPPLPSSQLTEAQKAKIDQWARTKLPAGGVACPICQTKNWTILPELLAPPAFHGGSLIIGGSSFPHFVMACTNCGNSQFINAVATGIVSDK
jgi:hypothetical protein